MPRYFFNLYNGHVAIDEEGAELPDEEAARERARREAVTMAAEAITSNARLVLHHRIDVLDEEGKTVASITFGDAVAIEE